MLEAHGWETIVVLALEPGNARDRLVAAGLRVTSVPFHRMRAPTRLYENAAWAASLRRERRWVSALLSQLRPDVVQIHGLTTPQCAAAAKDIGAAVVWQIIDTRAPWLLRHAARPWLLSLADVVMVTGDALRRQYRYLQRRSVPIVSFIPPVDTARFRRRADQHKPTTRTGHGPVIGTVASINPQKGLEYLLEAHRFVRKEFPSASLRIRGSTPQAHRRYEKRLKRRASVLGLPSDVIQCLSAGERVEEVLWQFDVFVLSSIPRSEGIPTTLLEAMAAGVPVVASNVGGVGEVVHQGKSGLLVPARTPTLLGKAVCLLLRDPTLRGRIVANAQQSAARLSSGAGCALTHLSAYEQALDRHTRTRVR